MSAIKAYIHDEACHLADIYNTDEIDVLNRIMYCINDLLMPIDQAISKVRRDMEKEKYMEGLPYGK